MLALRFPLVSKDSFIQEVRVERSSEQVNELNREGGFYTEKEMKDMLKFPEILYSYMLDSFRISQSKSKYDFPAPSHCLSDFCPTYRLAQATQEQDSKCC